MISIMNGVHCQTRTVTIDASGWSEMNATESKPRKTSTLVEDPEQRREHLLLPDQGCDDRHEQERCDQERADQPLPEELPVEQQREQRPEHERQHDRENGHLHARPHRLPEERVAEDRAVVVDPDELRRLRDQRLRLVFEVREAVVDADEERQLREQDREHERRQQRSPPTPRRSERISDAALRQGRPAWRRRCSRTHYLIAFDAMSWHCLSASVSFVEPAITLEKS